MITINGLTKAQVALLDTMWSIDSAEDYEQWKDGLSEDTMNTVDTLEQLVLLAELDEIEDSECGKAKKVLDKIMSLG
jgi:hypothetical protein